MKHTPGPWRVRHSSYDEYELNPASKSAAERGANARLIAAAPDLLEALQEVLAFFRNFDGPAVYDEINNPALDNARAAIVKARGAK